MPLEDRCCRLAKLRWFRMPPLGPELDDFCEWLCGQGFSRDVVRRRLCQVSHFNRYLRRLGVRDGRQVERSLGERFLHEHLPRCRCRGLPRSKQIGTPRSIRSFMDYLSERGVVAPASETSPPHETLLDEYLHYLKCDRNLAETTIKMRRQYLVPFLEGLGADAVAERLGNVTPEHVQAFFEKSSHDVGQGTRRQIQGSLRTFFRFCAQQGYLKRDLTQAVPQIRSYKLSPLPRGLSDLEQVDQDSRNGARDYALLLFLYNTGARVQEVVDLKVDDLRLDVPSQVKLTGKGRKQRVCPLWPETVAALRTYLKHREPDTARIPSVFLNANGQPITRFGIRYIVRRYAGEAAEVCPSLKSKKISPHAVRHTTAMHLLQSGNDLSVIKDWMGHADVNTTHTYLEIDMKMKRKALEASQPPDVTTRKKKRPKWLEPSILKWLDDLSKSAKIMCSPPRALAAAGP